MSSALPSSADKASDSSVRALDNYGRLMTSFASVCELKASTITIGELLTIQRIGRQLTDGNIWNDEAGEMADVLDAMLQSANAGSSQAADSAEALPSSTDKASGPSVGALSDDIAHRLLEQLKSWREFAGLCASLDKSNYHFAALREQTVSLIREADRMLQSANAGSSQATDNAEKSTNI